MEDRNRRGRLGQEGGGILGVGGKVRRAMEDRHRRER